MEKLGLNVLRERYLKFFESKEHLRLPSFPLVPQNDASLLLINSGMAPLKQYFTGSEIPPRKRITTCQKCMRTPDIENVGKTARHGTFFEMLGNFSFGDYFKKEAIEWAWEFFVVDLKIPENKLFVSIYEEDDEAFEIWNKIVGLVPEKIVRMGKKDNFWEHGVGPCGPCSEIYFDRGAENGCESPDCFVGCDCDRYVEVWNNVFTQFNRDENGNYTNLKSTNIDTGMGLERLACVMQGVNSIFEVDTIKNILNYICKKAKLEYGENSKNDISIRVITDHTRSTTMMICDGVIPSNEGRGYILRRLLRRAARHGKLIGIEGSFLHNIAEVVIKESKEAYPELEEKLEYIKKVIKIEEEKFETTIDQGLIIINEYINEIKTNNSNLMSGEKVFKLHDTYGFPVDLTREIAEENNIKIEEDIFKKLMNEQKSTAREALLKNKGNDAWGVSLGSKFLEFSSTKFDGYEKCYTSSKVVALLRDGNLVDIAQAGDNVTILLDETVFYAESGGQMSDEGTISSKDVVIKIEDCQKTTDGKFLHIGIIEKGILEKGAKVNVEIDVQKRLATSRNHTTTHLLHKALKNLLGNHVNQAGSLVGPERLRFDFSHFTGITKDELRKVENEVNSVILADLKVECKEMTIVEAKKLGATALFGEKYGNVVRVVTCNDYSMELCGGTHIKNTAQAGLIKIVSEAGVAAGVRRIEALTGENAIRYYNEKELLLNEIAGALKTTQPEVLKKIDALNDEIKTTQRELDELKNQMVGEEIENVLNKGIKIGNFKIITARFNHLDVDGLRNAGDMIKNKLSSGIVVLASSYGDKVNFIVMVTKDLNAKGIHAGNIIKEVAKIAGGSGGGRPDMAQAGGNDLTKIDEALLHSIEVTKSHVKAE